MFETVDVLIIGGGVIGSSVAMHLAQLGMSRIRVIDFDLEGSLSSSELNAGGVRAMWKEPLHVEMSKASIQYFSEHSGDVGYRACGYLWLHSEQTWDVALKAREGQASKEWPVEVWSPTELTVKRPFIDKTSDLKGALFAPRDGLINPNLLKNHFRSHAKGMGVTFDDRTLIAQVSYGSKDQPRIDLVAERFEAVISHETKQSVLTAEEKRNFNRTLIKYRTKIVVNCAGPWANRVSEILGYTSPSYPLRRQISLFDCRDVDLTPYGMIVDPSGVYYHPEASNGLAGFASPQEPKGMNFQYDGESFFQNMIWPALYERSTKFERLKHLTGWAGLYEVSPDEGALLGKVELGEPGKSGSVYEAHSFSGHGVMHSYAAGLALAELIVKGRYETMDAELLSAMRFEKNSGRRRVEESLII